MECCGENMLYITCEPIGPHFLLCGRCGHRIELCTCTLACIPEGITEEQVCRQQV